MANLVKTPSSIDRKDIQLFTRIWIYWALLYAKSLCKTQNGFYFGKIHDDRIFKPIVVGRPVKEKLASSADPYIYQTPAARGVSSGSPLFANSLAIFLKEYINLIAGHT